MTDATLIGSTITMHLDAAYTGYVAVQFDGPTVGPKGKRVTLLPNGGTAGIIAWQNDGSVGQFLNDKDQEYTKYSAVFSPQEVTVRVLKKVDASYADFAQSPGTVKGGPLLDAIRAKANGLKLKVNQWTFEDGADKVIVTIVMLDDQGGGDLRFTFGGQTFVIPLQLVSEEPGTTEEPEAPERPTPEEG
jgi:hypothetical protein